MKKYADLTGNCEKQRIKSLCDNKNLTGEFALEGNGRKGGWRYQDDKGEWHFTKGKKPQRTLHNAFTNNKAKIIRRAEQIFKEKLGD